jgi:hypothetical protein
VPGILRRKADQPRHRRKRHDANAVCWAKGHVPAGEVLDGPSRERVSQLHFERSYKPNVNAWARGSLLHYINRNACAQFANRRVDGATCSVHIHEVK